MSNQPDATHWRHLRTIPLLGLALFWPAHVMAQQRATASDATTSIVVSLPDSAAFEVTQFRRFDFKDTGIAVPSDGALAGDGGLIVTDLQAGQLTRLNDAGEVVWRQGGKGDGPGEYRFLYRLTVDSAGRVHAYDLGGSRVSILSPDGEFVERIQLDLMFRQVDGIRVLSDGSYLIVGIAGLPGEFVRHSMHTFSASGEYTASFGPLPVADSSDVLNYWGAGGVAIDANGNILFSRRLPYDFFRYTPRGELLEMWQASPEVEGTPDDAYVITRDAGQFTIAFSDLPVDRPLPPYFLSNGDILSGRLQGDNRRWDVFDGRGNLKASFSVPYQWGSVVGVDGARDAIWTIERSDYSTGILRLTVQSTHKR